MYSDDLVKWLMSIVSDSNINCPIFNVGSNKEISIIDLADKISKIFGVQIKFEETTISNEIDRYIPCIEKADKLLNLKIKMNIDQALVF